MKQVRGTKFRVRRAMVTATCGLALAAPMFCFAAPGDPPATTVTNASTPSTLETLITDLGSPDFDRRLTAHDLLRTSPLATLPQLEELLQSSTLDQEQRTRLADIARERFAAEPRAALGIRYANNNAWMAERRSSTPAVIETTLEGFDSARQLKAGDAVLSFDGSRITDRYSFRTHILSYNPGEVARLEIERDDKVLEVEVQMGSQDQLSQPNVDPNRPGDPRWATGTDPITESVLSEAWELRAMRNHLNVDCEESVLDCELSAARWRETWTSAQGARDPREPLHALTVAAGGAPRGGAPEAMREFVGGEVRNAGRMGRNPGMRDFQLLQLQQLQSRVEDLDLRIATIRRRLEGLTPEQLAQPQARLDTQALPQLTRERDNAARQVGELTARIRGSARVIQQLRR